MTPFEKLQQDHPVFKIKNKFNYAIPIPTADGEEILIQPYSIAEVRSADLIQVPDVTRLTMVQPTLKQMMEAGIFAQAKPADPAPPPADTAPGTDDPVADAPAVTN